jgi:hypothetical protein
MTFAQFFFIYLAGVLVIGVPLGALCILALRHPLRHPILARILFPLTDAYDIGRFDWVYPEQHNNQEYPTEALLVPWRELHFAFDRGSYEPIVRYVIYSALLWPLRLLWIAGWALLHLIARLLFGGADERSSCSR